MHRRQLRAQLGLSLLLMVAAGGGEGLLVIAGPKSGWGAGAAIAGWAILVGAAVYAFLQVRRHLQRLDAEAVAQTEAATSAASGLAMDEERARRSAESYQSALARAGESLDQARSKARLYSEQSGRANALAGETHAAADRGVREVAAIGDAVDALNQSSGEIAKILRTIDAIAFQTNILALNAAVEAARAGESGAGFAVVAQEVRRLAKDTADAARETSGKIDDAINWISQCELLKTEVVGTLNDVAGKARELVELVSAVSTATNEESETIAQVGEVVASIRQSLQTGASESRPAEAVVRHS